MIRLTDEQWERIRDHFPEENIVDGRPGRKPTPTRCVLEAVLWIFNTGAQWHMLPQSYPNYKTVHRRFQSWCRDEVLRRVSSTQPSSWPRVGGRKSELRSAERA
jgi:transposase